MREKTYKKMLSYTKKRKGAPVSEVVSYTLPKLHTGKTWYVDFLAFDPVVGKMRRKKYMLDAIKKVNERKARAAEIITNTTLRLRQGWNPWAEAGNNRQYTKFEDALIFYRNYILKMSARQSMKQKTCYDYLSRLGMLEEYNKETATPIIYIYQFDQGYISDFLDYIFMDRDASARTRNNYRTWLSTLCSWMVEKRYLDTNPVEKIKPMAEHTKFRNALTAEDLQAMREHLAIHNKQFLLACMMEYYTFIRPDELSRIKLRDIFIKEQKVFISSSISKNRRDGMVGLNDKIIRLMVELETFSHSSDYYLFGADFKPSSDKADSRIFRDYFVKLRQALGWPLNYQFYSLKDSGIRDLANAEGIVVARDQARHSDISTTNRYLKGDSLTVHEETKHFKGIL